MILNRQHRDAISLRGLQTYLAQVKAALRIRDKEINVCLVDNGAMRHLNRRFRGKAKTTDVLSFPWADFEHPDSALHGTRNEFGNFLGDVAISAEAAARNAQREGHSLEQEVRWLMLHGALHLMGYDHETDQGEMAALELRLREQLDAGRNGNGRKRSRKAGHR